MKSKSKSLTATNPIPTKFFHHTILAIKNFNLFFVLAQHLLLKIFLIIITTCSGSGAFSHYLFSNP